MFSKLTHQGHLACVKSYLSHLHLKPGFCTYIIPNLQIGTSGNLVTFSHLADIKAVAITQCIKSIDNLSLSCSIFKHLSSGWSEDALVKHLLDLILLNLYSVKYWPLYSLHTSSRHCNSAIPMSLSEFGMLVVVWLFGPELRIRIVLLISRGKPLCINPVVKDLIPTWENSGNLEMLLQKLKENCAVNIPKKLEHSI